MLVAKYYIDMLSKLCGVPRIIRGDCGTENVHIANTQRFLRDDGDDPFSGKKVLCMEICN